MTTALTYNDFMLDDEDTSKKRKATTIDYAPIPGIMGFVDVPDKPNATTIDAPIPGMMRFVPSEPATTIDYAPIPGMTRYFLEHFRKLAEIANNSNLWCEDAEPPDFSSIKQANSILMQLMDESEAVIPTRVVASAEGGVAICFINGNRYADIECLNSGEILAVLSNRNDRPIVWEVGTDSGGIARTVDRIREFLN